MQESWHLITSALFGERMYKGYKEYQRRVVGLKE